MDMILKREGFDDQYVLTADKKRVIIGRGVACDIVFNNQYVSRQHCEILRVPPHGSLMIKNLKATNVTYVDGLELKEQEAIAELRPGCRIGLGVPLIYATGKVQDNQEYVFLSLCRVESEDEIQVCHTNLNETITFAQEQGSESSGTPAPAVSSTEIAFRGANQATCSTSNIQNASPDIIDIAGVEHSTSSSTSGDYKPLPASLLQHSSSTGFTPQVSTTKPSAPSVPPKQLSNTAAAAVQENNNNTNDKRNKAPLLHIKRKITEGQVQWTATLAPVRRSPAKRSQSLDAITPQEHSHVRGGSEGHDQAMPTNHNEKLSRMPELTSISKSPTHRKLSLNRDQCDRKDVVGMRTNQSSSGQLVSSKLEDIQSVTNATHAKRRTSLDSANEFPQLISPIIDLTQEEPLLKDPEVSLQNKRNDISLRESATEDGTSEMKEAVGEETGKRKRKTTEETGNLTASQEEEDNVLYRRKNEKKGRPTVIDSDSDEEFIYIRSGLQSEEHSKMTTRIVSDSECEVESKGESSLNEKVPPKGKAMLTSTVKSLCKNNCSVVIEKLPPSDVRVISDDTKRIVAHGSEKSLNRQESRNKVGNRNNLNLGGIGDTILNSIGSPSETLSERLDMKAKNSEVEREGKSNGKRLSENYRNTNNAKHADAKENEAPEPPAKRHKRQSSREGKGTPTPSDSRRRIDTVSSFDILSDDDLPDIDVAIPYLADQSTSRGCQEEEDQRKKNKSKASRESSFVDKVSSIAESSEGAKGSQKVKEMANENDSSIKPKSTPSVKIKKEKEESNKTVKIERIENEFSPINIKKEPPEVKRKDDKTDDDDDDDDPFIVYSQADEPIWLSSDEEDSASVSNAHSDMSFGPPSMSPELGIEDLFDEHGKQNSMADKSKEISDAAHDDDDEWFPVLSQSFWDDDEEVAKKSSETSEPLPGPSGIHQHKNNDDLNDEDKWLELSQGFIDDDIDFEESKSSKNDVPDSIAAKATENLKNKDQRKSQLIDPKMPPPRTKNDTLRKRGFGSGITNRRSSLEKTSESENRKGDQSTSTWISPLPSHRKHTKLITPPKRSHKKKALGLRDDLAIQFNLRSYKATVEQSKKQSHHLVQKSESDKKGSTHAKSHLVTSEPRKDENISILKKGPKADAEGQAKSRSTVAAKMTSNNRSQKLINIDLFPSPEVPKPQSRKYKIPKSSGANKNADSTSRSPAGEIPHEPSSSSALCPKRNVTAKKPHSSTKDTSEENHRETSLIASVHGPEARISDQSVKISEIPSVQRESEKLEVSSNSGSIMKIHGKEKRTNKRVRFPNMEDLVQVREIAPREKQERFGSLSVKMKEVLPKEAILLKYNITNHYLDQFIYFVCRWNYDWLEAYRGNQERYSSGKLKEVLPPPIVENTTYPTLILYNSYNDYKEIFSTLMYYEVWENIYQDWLKFRNSSKWLPAQIDVVHPPNVDKRPDAPRFWVVKILTLITQDQGNRGMHPKQGSLVALKHHEGKRRTVFLGYVDEIIKSRKRNITKELESAMPEGEICLFIRLRVTRESINTVHLGKILHLSHISYIRPATRVWEGLCKLPLSPLAGDIINPSEEVFRCTQDPGEYIIHAMPLNDVQKKAVMEVTSKCIVDELVPKISLIHGPPGTGKTRTITALIAQMVKLSREKRRCCRILLCAPSNAAVDELSLRLIKLKQIGISLRLVRVGFREKTCPELRDYLLDSFVQKQVKQELCMPKNLSLRQELERKRQMVNQTAESLEKARKQNRSQAEIKGLELRLNELVRAKTDFEKSVLSHPNSQERYKLQQKWQEQILLGAEVITATLGGCVSSVLYEVMSTQPHAFTCCIIDEAGQCKETETWLPLLYGVRKLVMVGDHKQLPATVISQLAQDKNLKQSLFERFFYRYMIELQMDSLIHSLDVQYRMHPEIAEWPSQHFYLNKLTTSPEIVMERTHGLKPYLVFDQESQEEKQNNELYNPAEAALIRTIIEAIEPEVTQQKIAILTPYQRQKYKLEEKLARFFGRLNLVVNTIDAFQGQEKDIVILSFVRANKEANIGFLSQQQRLNVALTRARKSCFVVGNLSSLSSNKDWQSLIQNASSRGIIKTIKESQQNDRAYIRNLIFK